MGWKRGRERNVHVSTLGDIYGCPLKCIFGSSIYFLSSKKYVILRENLKASQALKIKLMNASFGLTNYTNREQSTGTVAYPRMP